MHVSLIELLRCPAAHEESALVAAATRQTDRRIVAGQLGCPVCGAVYVIHAGITDFRRVQPQDYAHTSDAPPNEDTALRLAAQLDLTEPGRVLALFGAYGRLAPALSIMFDAEAVVVNAAPRDEEHIAEHASVLRITNAVPLARSALQGAAVDGEHVARLGLDQVRELLRPNARLVAPSGAALPVGVRLVARDEREWVSTRTTDVVTLRRVPR